MNKPAIGLYIIKATPGGSIPVGYIPEGGFFGDVMPAGWLPCDGRMVSIKRYPELFAVIGYNYGNAPTPGYFQLPDLRARMVLAAQGGAS